MMGGNRTSLIVMCLLGLGFSSWAHAAPERVFTYHLAAPPDLLDPAKCSNLRCQRVMWPIYEPLVNLSKDSKTVVPGLAESWEVSPDGLTYTFQLRKGVTFHDGAPFNAMAARINLERNFLKGGRFYTDDPPNVREKVLAGLIKEIVVRDEHTLIIALKNRKVHLLILASMVSPEALAKYGNKLGEHPVGTGPFKFLHWTTDEIRLAANPDYWGGKPKLEEISFRIISQAEKTMKEFLGGRIDFLPEVEPVYLERIIANPAAKLMRVPTLSIFYLGFLLDRKPFDDIRVRQAIANAIDVDRAVLFTARGMAVPAYGPLPPGTEAYDPELKKPRYHPQVAKRLFKEAGHSGGLRLSLVFNADWGFLSELAQAIKADMRLVGITVELVPVSGWKELVAAARKGTADLFIYNWFSVFTDPEIFLVPNFQTGSVDNLTRYSNPKVDALLEQARAPMESSARIELYRNAQRIIVNNAPMVFLFHEVRLSASHTRVSGLELNVHSQPIDRFSRIELR